MTFYLRCFWMVCFSIIFGWFFVLFIYYLLWNDFLGLCYYFIRGIYCLLL